MTALAIGLLVPGCSSTSSTSDTTADTDTGLTSDTNTGGDTVETGDTTPADTVSRDSDSAMETGVDTDSGQIVDTGDPPASRGTWCWTVAPTVSGDVALLWVDPDTATWREAGVFAGPFDSTFHTNGIGRIGDELVMLSIDGSGSDAWISLDIPTSTLTVGAPVDSDAVVTSDGVSLWAQMDDDLCKFTDFSSLEAWSPDSCTSDLFASERIAVSGSYAYGAWHSQNYYREFDLASATQLAVIPLEDWDTWIWGMSVADGMLHLVNDDRGGYSGYGTRIARYDQHTGVLVDHMFLSDLPYSSTPSGLWCESD